ncbi:MULTISPECIES: hypothetical protein [Bradyrhizobium]|nr:MULTISPECIES: hypothetical protein [Bradyrhizobium]WOH52154.1 hypothetical protein RX328_07785 [Bradyrhizobium sp. sBnM-33]
MPSLRPLRLAPLFTLSAIAAHPEKNAGYVVEHEDAGFSSRCACIWIV